MNPVTNKKNYYRRWIAGEFGNRPQAWETWSDLVNSGYRGLVVARSRKPGQTARYKLSFNEAKEYIKDKESDFAFNEPTPDNELLIQGELEITEKGLTLSYCCDKITMREAMKKCKVVTGLQAKLLLQKFGQGAEDWLYDLLTKYQNHVIEFGLYDKPFGTNNSKLVIWEVRMY